MLLTQPGGRDVGGSVPPDWHCSIAPSLRGSRPCLVLRHYGLFGVLVRNWYYSRMHRSRTSPGPRKQKVWFLVSVLP